MFGAGVQACYRGPRLYDSPQTREIVENWVDFYKKHRKILDSDIIHIRRPDGKDYDGILHVDPSGEEKGLLMLYNPLDIAVQKTISFDIYYTGITETARVSLLDRSSFQVNVSSDNEITLNIDIPPGRWIWYVIK